MTVLLSIITINKDNATGLNETFKSALPNRKMEELEYIVIDGNSDDGSDKIILENQNKLNNIIIEDDLGIFDAMNKGLKYATGTYVLFLNSGDTLKNNVEMLLDATRSCGDIDVFYSDIAIKDRPSIQIDYSPLLLIYHCLNHQNMIVKRSYLASGYDLNYKHGADVKWQIDHLSQLKLKKLSEPISYFDLEGNSSKKDRKKVEEIWRERLKAHYTSKNHSLSVKIAAVSITSIIYLIKFIRPGFFSRV